MRWHWFPGPSAAEEVEDTALDRYARSFRRLMTRILGERVAPGLLREAAV